MCERMSNIVGLFSFSLYVFLLFVAGVIVAKTAHVIE